MMRNSTKWGISTICCFVILAVVTGWCARRYEMPVSFFHYALYCMGLVFAYMAYRDGYREVFREAGELLLVKPLVRVGVNFVVLGGVYLVMVKLIIWFDCYAFKDDPSDLNILYGMPWVACFSLYWAGEMSAKKILKNRG